MVATSNPMTYGIGAGNSLAYGSGGNGHYCLGGVSRNLFNESRMNNFGGGGGSGMGAYGLMMPPQNYVFPPYAQAMAAATSMERCEDDVNDRIAVVPIGR